MNLPACPQCQSTLTYPDGDLLVCPECGHEWPASEVPEVVEAASPWRDAVGNELKDGDTVTLIKDLKLKGSSQVLKVGTKARNIRRIEGDHDIDCKVDGVGAMQLKSAVVKKA
jgi:protein PhnA